MGFWEPPLSTNKGPTGQKPNDGEELMPQFRVRLTRDCTESTDVVVSADTAVEANVIALEMAGRHGECLDTWTLDDNQHEVYLPDPDSTVEEDT